MSGFVGSIHTCIRLTRADRLFASLAGHHAYLRWLIPLREHYASDDEVRVTRDGVAFSLNRSDYMQWHVFANLPEHSWRVALRTVPEDAIVFDVGANVGAFSLKLAKKGLDRGRSLAVYAFEPNPTAMERLIVNLDLNPELRGHVEVRETALGDRAGFADLTFDERNTGGASLVSAAFPGETATVAVRMETLDQFVTDNGIERVDFIKVDVEGYEPLVLAGATDTIRFFRPVLYLEMTNDWFDKTGHSNESVLRFLSERHDYRFFRMNGSEEEEITSEEDVNAYPQFDLVAYPG